MKIIDAVNFGKQALSAAEFDERERESNVYFLLSSLLKMSIPNIKFNPNNELSPEQERTFNKWIERRLALEPVQYITGETEFWSLPIYVGEGVLVPRQDTETIVAEVKKYFTDDKKKYLFLDMCCGSGCIGISLLTIFPNSTVVFVDKYSKPIEYTNKNLERLGLKDRAQVITSNMFKDLPKEYFHKFDAIVSNPPYIPDEELKGLPLQITLFEPTEALKAGTAGLSFHSVLSDQALRFLKPKAPLFTEIGYNQGKGALALFEDNGWNDTHLVKDMTGNTRVLVAKS